MNELTNYGILGVVLVVFAIWYAKKDKQHSEHVERIEKLHREERDAAAKTAERNYDRLMDISSKMNDSFNRNTDMVSSIKTILENKK